jgi:DNA-binding NarL/FixJ family response regulator
VQTLAIPGEFRRDRPPCVAEHTKPRPASRFGLTQRETDVLELVCAGCTNRQIAERLFISPKATGLHVPHILTKLGMATRGEAAARAHRLGLTAPAPVPAGAVTAGPVR